MNINRDVGNLSSDGIFNFNTTFVNINISDRKLSSDGIFKFTIFFLNIKRAPRKLLEDGLFRGKLSEGGISIKLLIFCCSLDKLLILLSTVSMICWISSL